MNDKYKELCQQATHYCEERGEFKAWLWEEKLVELTLKEVIRIAEYDVCHSPRDLADALKEHFGID